MTIRASAEYTGPVRDAVVALKRGERAYLEPLAGLLAPLVPEGAILVPVRTTRRRAAERGFDQACELACRVALRRFGRCADVLRKHGAPQRGQSRQHRLAAHGRFEVRAAGALPPAVWLLDDVVTTGATLCDAAAALEAAGCRVLGAVTVARTARAGETSRGERRLVEA